MDAPPALPYTLRPAAAPRERRLDLPARPGAISWRPEETALVVIDMQNGFLKSGGYFAIVGYDLGHAQHTIARVARSIAAARMAGVQVVFIQSGFDARHLCVGGPTAPVWHKSEAQILMHQRPELAYKLITDGTWDYELVEEMAPRPDEPVIRKSRYSAFAGTNMNQYLSARRMVNLVFAGVATNVCVESTLRDAYHHEFFCLLLEDATHHAGPPFLKDATLWNVERFFGWVGALQPFEAACAALA
jgi:ureidoacrylate peracid hydrolase